MICLGVNYAVETSDDMVPMRLKWWLDESVSTVSHTHQPCHQHSQNQNAGIERNLADILATNPTCAIAETIRAKLARASPRLLTFLNFPGKVDVTNNACERALRPAVIQRIVTNGFRSMWAAKGDCAVRTVVDTAKLSGQTPFLTILTTLN